MSIEYRPASLLVSAPALETHGRVVTGWTQETGATVLCQINPLAPSVAYERWGVDLGRPHEAYCNVEDAAAFLLNGLCIGQTTDDLDLTGRRWVVAGVPRVHAYGGPNDMAVVLLDEVTT